jgi:Tfp pilus assembly PilM family ATPase/Tfp pilus assembly protein PilN
MPGKILGLDLNNNSITAVQVLSGLKSSEIIACCRVMIEQDQTLDQALEGLFEQIDPKSDSCIASIPAEDVSFHNIQMPFSDRKKIRQTLPFEIEAEVPLPVDDLIIDFNTSNHSDKNNVLAVCAKKKYLAECLTGLQSAGVNPDILDVRSIPMVSWLINQEETPDNGMLFDIGLKRNTMILFLNRQITLIRTFYIKEAEELIADQDKRDDESEEEAPRDTISPEQIESCLKIFCDKVKSTLHSFKSLNGKELSPKKIFFTGAGALYPGTDDLLSRFMDMPASQLHISGDKRVNMDRGISRVWDSALMDNALALVLRDNRKNRGFNFRKDEFEIKNRYEGLKKEITKIALSIIIVLMFLGINQGVDYFYLNNSYQELKQKEMELFAQIFPGVKDIKTSPLQMAKSKMIEIKNAVVVLPAMQSDQKVIDILKEISERLPSSIDVLFSNLMVDAETVRISGDTDTYKTVDNIRSSLEKSDYFRVVDLLDSQADKSGARIEFELKLIRTEQ